MDQEVELGGGPEGVEVGDGDQARVWLPAGEQRVGVMDVFLEGLQPALAQGVRLVFIHFYQHWQTTYYYSKCLVIIASALRL